MAKDDKPQETGTSLPPETQGPRDPEPDAGRFDAKADKAYEQRRAGLLPPDSRLDRLVLAARKHRVDLLVAARAAAAAARAER